MYATDSEAYSSKDQTSQGSTTQMSAQAVKLRIQFSFDSFVKITEASTLTSAHSISIRQLLQRSVLHRVCVCVQFWIIMVTLIGLSRFSNISLQFSAVFHYISLFAPSVPRSTQPCIPSGSPNRVPASAGVKAGKSPLPGGR